MVKRIKSTAMQLSTTKRLAKDSSGIHRRLLAWQALYKSAGFSVPRTFLQEESHA